MTRRLFFQQFVGLAAVFGFQLKPQPWQAIDLGSTPDYSGWIQLGQIRGGPAVSFSRERLPNIFDQVYIHNSRELIDRMDGTVYTLPNADAP